MSTVVTSHYPLSELLVFRYCRSAETLPPDDIINLMVLFCKILPMKIELFTFEFSDLFEEEYHYDTHIFSNPFGDDNWCLTVEKGEKNSIAVHLLQLPPRVKSVECRFKFQLLSNENIWNIHKVTQEMHFGYENGTICEWKNVHYEYDYQNIVMISIEILKVIDDDGNEIQESHWRDFNVDRLISYTQLDANKYVWKDWDNSWDFVIDSTTKVSWL